MDREKTKFAIVIGLIWLVFSICFSCAKSPYINVDYRVSGTQQDLIKETPVHVETVDNRNEKTLLNKNAQRKFPTFSGLFSLTIREFSNQKVLLGNYTLPLLFETAFTHRLTALGVPTTDQASPEALTLQIEVSEFQISLVEGNWHADIEYRANLSNDGERIAGETVIANAQRLKGLGRGGAEKVISEIFTDAVNRLNIEKLLQKASVN